MRRQITSPYFYLSLGILVLLVFLMCGTAETRTVASVYDGDTFTMTDGERVRMAYIDAPEQKQFYGDEAREFLIKTLNYGNVRLKPTGKDKYGRTICEVYVGKVNVNELMVREGYAWAYKKYSHLYPLQIEAMAAKKGLWRYPNIPPYIFRKRSKT